jgi:hypothetical protein
MRSGPHSRMVNCPILRLVRALSWKTGGRDSRCQPVWTQQDWPPPVVRWARSAEVAGVHPQASIAPGSAGDMMANAPASTLGARMGRPFLHTFSETGMFPLGCDGAFPVPVGCEAARGSRWESPLHVFSPLKKGSFRTLNATRCDMTRHGQSDELAHSIFVIQYSSTREPMSSTLRDPRVPSPFNRRRLTVATLGISDAAIARAYADPKTVRESTLLRLQKAAKELGLPIPGEELRQC